ncbi:MAG TPA: heme ABC exporter ATP-binding protein CcmA [Chloroflexota bacterium]|jgi:heme exporter protein A
MTSLAVDARAIGRHFGLAAALRSATVCLAPGERLAILGPNGAGKTTLLRVLATLLAPSAGTLRIFGLDPRRAEAAVRRRIGVVGHRPYLDESLTAAETLAFYARLYDVADAARRIPELLELVGLAGRRDERVGALSRGQQQRLALARALVHRPDLLLLDEPDTGLDAAGHHLLSALLERPRDPLSVVFTTHQLSLAARLAPRAILLVGGRTVAEGPPLDLAPASDGAWGLGNDRLEWSAPRASPLHLGEG